MAQSKEYPDLRWVTPKAWNKGRESGRPSLIVIHTTEGSEGLKSAEDGAAYDARRTDGTSTHYHHDEDTTIQCVRTEDRANTAKGTGNHRGIHHELCGRAAQDLTQWHDDASVGTLINAARQCARDAKKWNIPVKHLTVAEVRADERGFCGHVDITNAFHESTHTDPGAAFPWTEFLTMVREEMNNVAITQAEIDKVAKAAAREVWELVINSPAMGVTERKAADWLKYGDKAVRAVAALPALAVSLTPADLDAIVQGVAGVLGPQLPSLVETAIRGIEWSPRTNTP